MLIGECMEQNGTAMELHVSQGWQTFYQQYPVPAILSTMHIEDANGAHFDVYIEHSTDFPISEITFEYKGKSCLKIDKP